jgi:hypothetical protein
MIMGRRRCDHDLWCDIELADAISAYRHDLLRTRASPRRTLAAATKQERSSGKAKQRAYGGFRHHR